jgi:hypothetical protein
LSIPHDATFVSDRFCYEIKLICSLVSPRGEIDIYPMGDANLWPGATVSFQVRAPVASTLPTAYVMTTSNYWQLTDQSADFALTPGAWRTINYTIPYTFPGGIQWLWLGLDVAENGSNGDGKFYVDSVEVCGGVTNCAGNGAGRFDFESTDTNPTLFSGLDPTDGWKLLGTDPDPIYVHSSIAQTTTKHYGSTGTGSLQVSLTLPSPSADPAASCRQISIAPDSTSGTTMDLYCGQTVTFHVYATSIYGLSVQPFSQQNGWVMNLGPSTTLAAVNTWTTLTYTIPADINSLGLQSLGLQFSNLSLAGQYSGIVYVDAISW